MRGGGGKRTRASNGLAQCACARSARNYPAGCSWWFRRLRFPPCLARRRKRSGRGRRALGLRGRASGWSRVFWSASASAMSAASCCRPHPPQGPTLGRDIPGPAKRLILPDGAALPPGDYSTTPGGTLFGTTPGGTRIIYDRKFLMECRNSPVAKTPPCDLPDIPGVTSPTVQILGTETNLIHAEEEKQPGLGEEAQFDMDI
ncbi:eukaryotic translation initiation factor 4E-binding protein 1 [Lacerta agilis]|uniref:eukaryotic translation initiation factor 4E-binding protein 1 n=1 Tax=Lacerta agilis TaxID=80427 RepID=UPI0014195B91|nr:eukaryotic translation initiation factor 4E-binding protein 1 [Lacerta agilis]